MSKAAMNRYFVHGSWLTPILSRLARALCVVGAALFVLVAGPALIVGLGDAGALAGEATSNWKPVVKYAGKKARARKPKPKAMKPKARKSKVRPAAAAASNGVVAKQKPRKKMVQSKPMVRQTALTKSYCENMSDAAADARFAWQKSELETLQAALDDRLKKLAARTVELKTWLQRRKAFAKTAQTRLIKIYAGMRPDVAALQLAVMDDLTASALLSGLKPRVASTILNEMKPKRAARLTSIIAGAARVEPQSKAGGATDGKRK